MLCIIVRIVVQVSSGTCSLSVVVVWSPAFSVFSWYPFPRILVSACAGIWIVDDTNYEQLHSKIHYELPKTPLKSTANYSVPKTL